MQENDKELTQLIKSMKRNLQAQFGFEIPHSALRASLLMAHGENPHAYAGKVVEKRPDIEVLVLFAWTYPEESGGAVEARVNLETGRLSGMQVGANFPVDGERASARIIVAPEDCAFDAHFQKTTASTGDWFVDEKALRQLREVMVAESWRVPTGLIPEHWKLRERTMRWFCVSYKEDAQDDDESVFKDYQYVMSADRARSKVQKWFPRGEVIDVVECAAVVA